MCALLALPGAPWAHARVARHDVGYGLARYNPDGSPDTTFNSSGLVSVRSPQQGFTNALAIQSDGSIVLAGVTSNVATGVFGFGVLRYNADGTQDTALGQGGSILTRIGGLDAEGNAVALQPDGKIILAGTAISGGGTGDQVALVRYNADGNLDSAFGAGGTVTTGYGQNGVEARGAVLQPDGKIVIAGTAFANGPTDDDFLLARYNSDGSLDQTFGTNGLVTTDFGVVVAGPDAPLDRATAVALQSDGKIVAAGTTGGRFSDFGVARYSPDGSLDAAFGTNGRAIGNLSPGAHAYALAIQPDGAILVAGSAAAGTNGEPFAVVRLRSDGSLDSSFGVGGTVTATFEGGSAGARAIAIAADGGIVVGGSGFGLSSLDANGQEVLNGGFALVRYRADGTLDTSFGTGGRVLTTVGDAGAVINSLALQPDGRIVVAGLANFRVLTARADR